MTDHSGTFQPTAHFRWAQYYRTENRPTHPGNLGSPVEPRRVQHTSLQQAWQDVGTGEIKWCDVPTVETDHE